MTKLEAEKGEASHAILQEFASFAISVMIIAQRIWNLQRNTGRKTWWRMRGATAAESEALGWAADAGLLAEKRALGQWYYRAGKYEPRLCYRGKAQACFDGLIAGIQLAQGPQCVATYQIGTERKVSNRGS